MDRATMQPFVAANRYAVVASTAADGCAQCALVGIAITSEMEVVFDTFKDSRKYPNLLARPACSLVIGWEREQTLQVQGSAFEPTSSALASYRNSYLAVWPEGRERASNPDVAYLVVRPLWLRYSDYNNKQPPIEEMHL